MSEEPGFTCNCPVCGKTWREKVALSDFVERINKAWMAWKPLPEYLEKRLRFHNNATRLEKILTDKGFLTVFCQNCALAATVAAATAALRVE